MCALVDDEQKQLEAELAKLARGVRTNGLCSSPFAVVEAPGESSPRVEVVISSPDGPAVVGLDPEPTRVEVTGPLTLRRREVARACALVNGQPAEVKLSPAKDGKQLIEVRRRPSVPLKVTVKLPGKAPEPTGILYAIPPFDWPDTEARPVDLPFAGGTSVVAPDRVPSEPGELGVWSIVSVRSGNRVAAKLIGPTETQVTLTPGPAATLHLSVKAGSTALPLQQLWFADVPPGEPVTCTAEEGLARWGIRALNGETQVTVEAPPGSRRCLFVAVNAGAELGTVGTKVPSKAGSSRRVLRYPAADEP